MSGTSETVPEYFNITKLQINFLLIMILILIYLSGDADVFDHVQNYIKGLPENP